MPDGKGTYGSKMGRPKKKSNKVRGQTMQAKPGKKQKPKLLVGVRRVPTTKPRGRKR